MTKRTMKRKMMSMRRHLLISLSAPVRDQKAAHHVPENGPTLSADLTALVTGMFS
jgi:hypothetical protein